MINDNNIFLSSSTELTRIDVQELKVGMYVSKLDRPWLETSFLFQGFELKNAAEIKEVQAQCDFVYIDTLKQKKDTRLKQKNTVFSKGWLEGRETPVQKINFNAEFEYAESVYHETTSLVKSFMQEIALGRALNAEIAKKAVAQCVQSVINSPDALMWMTQLKNKDEYTSQHSMNVCVFAIALGRHINLSEPELEELGLCGMMHDMGKIKIPLEILNKPGLFDPEERKVMKTHTALGWKLLMASSGMSGCAIDAAYGHHERLDGKGYPRGLTEECIHPYTRIVTITDMYDAIVSNRVYRKGRTHLEAIKLLIEYSGTQLDSALVIKFIECLGIYPTGSIVELTNGEVAIVVEVNQAKKLKPKIIILLNKKKIRVEAYPIDLAKTDTDKTGEKYRIKRIARAEEYDLDTNLLYKMGMINNKLAIS